MLLASNLMTRPAHSYIILLVDRDKGCPNLAAATGYPVDYVAARDVNRG